MSKQYYIQHIDQDIRYIILTNVGPLVTPTIGACVGDGITGELVGATTVGALVRPIVGATVGDGITGALVSALVGALLPSSPQLAQNGPPTSWMGLV